MLRLPLSTFLAGAMIMTAIVPSSLRAEEEPTRRVRLERNVRIPMRDGLTLSADLTRPDEPGQFPICIEYHPYRKDDVTWRELFA